MKARQPQKRFGFGVGPLCFRPTGWLVVRMFGPARCGYKVVPVWGRLCVCRGLLGEREGSWTVRARLVRHLFSHSSPLFQAGLYWGYFENGMGCGERVKLSKRKDLPLPPLLRLSPVCSGLSFSFSPLSCFRLGVPALAVSRVFQPAAE